MPLFKRTRVEIEPTVRPNRTLSGLPQTTPESYGQWARRQRLFQYAVEMLRDHPLAAASAYGRPLGDGYGMEPLVELIKPVFAMERSLVKWVGLRGAIASLWQCGPLSWEEMSRSVGLVPEERPDGVEWVLGDRPADMSDAAMAGALGVHASVMMKVANYDEIQSMSLDQVRSEPRWFLMTVNELHGYDYIVWAAIVTGRLEALNRLPAITAEAPEPSQLEEPGWYVDPMFAKADRYWDGTDWTAQCREAGGGGSGSDWVMEL